MFICFLSVVDSVQVSDAYVNVLSIIGTVNMRHNHTKFSCLGEHCAWYLCTPDLLVSDLSCSTWLQQMHFFLFPSPPSTTPLLVSALTWMKYYFHSLWYAHHKRITFWTYYHYSKGVPHIFTTCTCSGTHSTWCFSSNTNNVWNTVSGLTVMACRWTACWSIGWLRNECSMSRREAPPSSQLVPYRLL